MGLRDVADLRANQACSPFRSSSSVSETSLNQSLLVLNWYRRNRISPPRHCKKVEPEAPRQEAFLEDATQTRDRSLNDQKEGGVKVHNASLSLRLCYLSSRLVGRLANPGTFLQPRCGECGAEDT